MNKYAWASEVQHLVQTWVYETDEFTKLRGHIIKTVFIDKAPTKNNKTVYGNARIVGGLMALLAQQRLAPDPDKTADSKPVFVNGNAANFFLIQISYDIWESYERDKEKGEERKRHLVFHELCHCYVDEDDAQTMLEHDLTVFNREVDMFGLDITRDLASFSKRVLKKAKQESLGIFDTDEPVPNESA